MKVRGRFYVAFTVQMLILLIVVIGKQHTTRVGYQLVLASAPVDAHEPFDGDHLVLRYPISTLPRPAFDPAVGDRVYVSPGGGDAAPAVQPVRPGDGRVWLRGLVTARDQERIDVEYGIERYSLRDPRARTLDWAAGSLAVEVRVDGAGRAAIRHLLMDGRRIDLEEPGAGSAASRSLTSG